MANINELLNHGHIMADGMGKISAGYYYIPTPAVEMKADNFPVTVADRETEQYVHDYLKLHRPNDNIWGEELGKTAGKLGGITWILDPIDSTKGNIDGLAIWTNLLAAFEDDRLLFGIVNNPITGERFWGGSDLPSRYSYNDPSSGQRVETAIRCLETVSIDRLVWRSTTKDYMDPADRAGFDALAKVSKPREGGDAMIYAALARGRNLNCVFDGDMATWDIAAPAGVVLGAKGIVTDAYGDPINFFREGKTTVVAAATKPLHKQVLTVLAEARRPAFDIGVPAQSLDS